MSLLLRRRAILQNGGRAKGGIGDGIISMIKTGSNTMTFWTSYDVGQTFYAGASTMGYVQAYLVPDSWISRTEQRIQYNSGSTILNGPVYIGGPSGSTGGSWSRLIIRGLAGSDSPTVSSDLAYLKLRFSGSNSAFPSTGNTLWRPANVVASPGANKIVYLMPTASIICNLKDWIDITYPNNDCRTSVEFLRKEVARLIVEGTGTTARAVQATASCLQSPVNYNANGGGIIALHVTNSYTTVYAASGKPEFSKDDNLTYGILMTTAYWKGTMTAISPRFLITTDGCNSWYTLEQKMASSQSLGAITGSSCIISADGKNSAFFVSSYGGQPGVILGKNYFQEFEFKSISSLNFPVSVSRFIDQAAASDDLKVVYVADVSSSVFVSRDGMKSWELAYSGSVGNAATAYTQLVCSSTGEYAQFLIHPRATTSDMSKITFSDFGRQYTINTQSLKFDRQNFMYRSTGQYDDVEAYKETQDILAISASVSSLFFGRKGNPATALMKSGEIVNLPAVTKDPQYSQSMSVATGSEGTVLKIVMAPGYTPEAWGLAVNDTGVNMSNLNYISRWLYTSGNVKSISVEGDDSTQYSMSREEMQSYLVSLFGQINSRLDDSEQSGRIYYALTGSTYTLRSNTATFGGGKLDRFEYYSEDLESYVMDNYIALVTSSLTQGISSALDVDWEIWDLNDEVEAAVGDSDTTYYRGYLGSVVSDGNTDGYDPETAKSYLASDLASGLVSQGICYISCSF